MNAPKISILSQRSAMSDHRVKAAGKIRAGIKVLTKAAAENKTAAKLYEEGRKQRLKFSEIEKQIVAATNISNPMYPRNTQYFSVASTDFGMPEIAERIVARYGEVRGHDPEKRLYRFPVVFHSDDLGDIYPNSYRRYGGEPGYESHYGEDGVRYCRFLPPVTKEMVEAQKARRIKRPPRRDKVVRGVCEPNKCPEFLQGQCRFRGTLNFYIPGIPTTGLLVMETTSEYAAETIWSDLDRIHGALGLIPRTNPNDPSKPVFWITKVEETRTYYDEIGNKKTGLQWVPKLQADIDLGALIATRSVSAPKLAAPVTWLAQLPAPSVEDTARSATESSAQTRPSPAATQTAGAMAPETTGSQPSVADLVDAVLNGIEELQVSEELAAMYFDAKLGCGWENDAEKAQQALDQIGRFKIVGRTCAQKLVAITVAVNELQLDQTEFQRYLALKYGASFTKNDALLAKIVEEVCQLTDSGSEFATSYVRAEIRNLEAKQAA